jgi:hypothetical protein
MASQFFEKFAKIVSSMKVEAPPVAKVPLAKKTAAKKVAKKPAKKAAKKVAKKKT